MIDRILSALAVNSLSHATRNQESNIFLYSYNLLLRLLHLSGKRQTPSEYWTESRALICFKFIRVSQRLQLWLLLSTMCCFLILPGNTAVAAENNREMVIGIEPEHNIFDQVERYRSLTRYLSDKLGFPIRITILSRYGEIIKRLKTRRIDGAFLSSYPAASAIRELGLQPVAKVVDLNGNTFCHGFIFVRNDSGIASVNDMKGKTIVFVDPLTTTGYLFPMVYLQQHGGQDKDKFFGSYYFSGSHASSVSAVLDGKADIGVAKSKIFNKLSAKDSSIRNELTILADSPPCPTTTLCLRQDISESEKEKIVSVLLEMDQTVQGKEVLAEFEALRYIDSGKSDYDSIMKMIEFLEKNTQ